MVRPAFAGTAEFHRVDAGAKLVPQKRAALGQYMTSAPIGRFMASLFGVEYRKGRKTPLGDFGSLSRPMYRPMGRICSHPRGGICASGSSGVSRPARLRCMTAPPSCRVFQNMIIVASRFRPAGRKCWLPVVPHDRQQRLLIVKRILADHLRRRVRNVDNREIIPRRDPGFPDQFEAIPSLARPFDHSFASLGLGGEDALR